MGLNWTTTKAYEQLPYLPIHPLTSQPMQRGGAHLGSITITGAQIGRQQRSARNAGEDDNEYRHAFLVIEGKKGPGGSQIRHVLCAESDIDRDNWVQVLVRYVMGTYNEDASSQAGTSIASAPKSSTSMDEDGTSARRVPTRGMSKDNIVMGSAVPISQLAPDANNAKLMQAAPYPEALTSSSPNGTDPEQQSPSDSYAESKAAKRIYEVSNPPPVDAQTSSSLPSSSPLDGAEDNGAKRSASELGWYPDAPGKSPAQLTAEAPRSSDRQAHRKSHHPNLNQVKASPTNERPATPENAPAPPQQPRSEGKTKISGPIGGGPIPSGIKFGAKELAPAELTAPAPSNDRREKAKSRSFWGFGGRNHGGKLAYYRCRRCTDFEDYGQLRRLMHLSLLWHLLPSSA